MGKEKKKEKLFVFSSMLLFTVLMSLIEYLLRPNYLFKCLIKLSLIAAMIILYGILYKPDLKGKLSLRFPKDRRFYLFLIGIYLLVLSGFFIFSGRLDLPGIRDSLMEKEGLSRQNCLYVFAYIIFVNSFIEELFFRVYPLLSGEDELSSMVLSSLLFSFYHMGIISGWFDLLVYLLSLLALFVAGMFLHLADRHYKTYTAGWLIHMFANLAINTIGTVIMFRY